MPQPNAFGMQALTNLSSELKNVDRKFANAVRKNVRAAVSEAGADVVGRVQRKASWSSRIPSATKVSVRFSTKGASVKVTVDKNRAPHARGLELGNKTAYAVSAINARGGYKTVNGRRVAVDHAVYEEIRRSGSGFGKVLRHPVFDSGRPPKRVGEQPTRPFFFPALKEAKPGIDLRMEAAVTRSAREAGFK